jgi:NADPH:quinone reductase-like Zn-dependent oxidoreductase
VIAGVATERVADMQTLARLAQAGEFKPVIDRCYPLERAAEAHTYVDTGRKKGNVVLTVRSREDAGGVPDEAA